MAVRTRVTALTHSIVDYTKRLAVMNNFIHNVDAQTDIYLGETQKKRSRKTIALSNFNKDLLQGLTFLNDAKNYD